MDLALDHATFTTSQTQKYTRLFLLQGIELDSGEDVPVEVVPDQRINW